MSENAAPRGAAFSLALSVKETVRGGRVDGRVQPGPLNPELFNGGMPTLDATGKNTIRQALTPGQTLTLKLISGATIFVTPSGTPSNGATVRASDITPNFQGSLSQGPIPTPAPDYY